MAILSTAEAAARLGVSVRRVQQLVKSGQLPAKEFGGSLMIEADDLKLVESRPKVGRPAKPKEEAVKGGKKRGSKK